MNKEINLKLVWNALIKNIIWIILATVVISAGAGAYAYFQDPVYSSTATFYSINVSGDISYSSSTLVSAQQMLVNDFIEIIKSDKCLELVKMTLKKEHDKDFEVSQIRGMISASQINDTSAFTVTVQSINPTDARIVVDTVAICMGTIIDETVKRENSVEILSMGSDSVKVSPVISVYILVGAALSFVLTSAVFVLIALFDRTIRTEEDIKKHFKQPIIGVIPIWDVASKE